jgi:hypothetical protein
MSNSTSGAFAHPSVTGHEWSSPKLLHPLAGHSLLYGVGAGPGWAEAAT